MHEILQRLEEAQRRNSEGHNCISAAFYLVGLDDQEGYYKPGDIETYSSRIRRVQTFEEAALVGYELRDPEKYGWHERHIEHLVVIHPDDRSKIIERATADAEIRIEDIDPILSYLQQSSKWGPAFFAV